MHCCCAIFVIGKGKHFEESLILTATSFVTTFFLYFQYGGFCNAIAVAYYKKKMQQQCNSFTTDQMHSLEAGRRFFFKNTNEKVFRYSYQTDIHIFAQHLDFLGSHALKPNRPFVVTQPPANTFTIFLNHEFERPKIKFV